MRILSALLVGAMLVMVACGSDATPAPTQTPVETPTPAVIQDATPDTPTAEASTAVTDTTIITDTTDVMDTTNVTDTIGMTVTDTMTDTMTDPMTDTGAMSELMIRATLQDADGNEVGQATFSEGDNGVLIQVEVQGLTVEAAGEHGIHIHTMGACTPDFQAAGGHFNPTNTQHGLDNPNGPHAGDLPNITIDENGNATYEAVAELVTLDEGDNSLLDSDGSAIIIHAGPDDMVTDPAGDSGDRIACGVILPQ